MYLEYVNLPAHHTSSIKKLMYFTYMNMQNLCDRTDFKPYYTAQAPYLDPSLLIMVIGCILNC